MAATTTTEGGVGGGGEGVGYIGACPTCGEAIDFAAYLPAGGVCAACGRRYMVVVPELDGPPDEAVEVTLLAAGGDDGDERELPRPVKAFGVLLLGGLSSVLLLFALLIFVALMDPEMGGGTPLEARVVMTGIGLLCAGAEGWVAYLLIARRGARAAVIPYAD